MNLNIKSILSLCVLLAIYSCNEDEKQTVVTKTQLVMSEEFNTNGAPDSSLWSYDIGNGNNMRANTSRS